MNESFVDELRKRYSHIHPLIFHRSLERARDASGLFDILESIPEKYPIVWDEPGRAWRHEEDILLKEQLGKTKKKKG